METDNAETKAEGPQLRRRVRDSELFRSSGDLEVNTSTATASSSPNPPRVGEVFKKKGERTSGGCSGETQYFPKYTFR